MPSLDFLNVQSFIKLEFCQGLEGPPNHPEGCRTFQFEPLESTSQWQVDRQWICRNNSIPNLQTLDLFQVWENRDDIVGRAVESHHKLLELSEEDSRMESEYWNGRIKDEQRFCDHRSDNYWVMFFT